MNEYLVAMRESFEKAQRLVAQKYATNPRMVTEELINNIAGNIEDIRTFALMSIAESLAMLAENAKPPEE